MGVAKISNIFFLFFGVLEISDILFFGGGG